MADLTEPLDAYQTAEPCEPVFTLQGGDPLAAALVRLWAAGARLRVGLGHDLDPSELKSAALTFAPENEHESDELKTRATAAEEVSWRMDEYRKGQHGAGEAETPDEKLSTRERLDLHDLRVMAASRISNMFSELSEIEGRLTAARFDGTDNLWPVLTRVLIKNLHQLHDVIEPAIQRQRYARKS